MRSVISITDLSKQEIEQLIDTACDIMAQPDKYSSRCRGKKLATLFYEPSTRTRLSFEAAMFWAFPMRKALRPPRGKAWRIPQRLSPALPI